MILIWIMVNIQNLIQFTVLKNLPEQELTGQIFLKWYSRCKLLSRVSCSTYK